MSWWPQQSNDFNRLKVYQCQDKCCHHGQTAIKQVQSMNGVLNEWCVVAICDQLRSNWFIQRKFCQMLRRMVQLHQMIQSMKCQSMLRWKVLWVNGVKRVQSIKSKQKLRQIMYWWPTAIKHVQSMKIMLKWMVYDHYGGHLLVYYQTSKPVQMMKCK